METKMSTATKETTAAITPKAFLEHWQGHRRLTRKTIEAFPEKELFEFSVGGMRPFSALVLEMIAMATPGIDGIVTGKWGVYDDKSKNPKTKEELLSLWDEVTEKLDTLWPQIPEGRFQEVDVAFGQWEGPIYGTLLYFIDNEIHHRGQGYVYLRALEIAPPFFWER